MTDCEGQKSCYNTCYQQKNKMLSGCGRFISGRVPTQPGDGSNGRIFPSKFYSEKERELFPKKVNYLSGDMPRNQGQNPQKVTNTTTTTTSTGSGWSKNATYIAAGVGGGLVLLIASYMIYKRSKN